MTINASNPPSPIRAPTEGPQLSDPMATSKQTVFQRLGHQRENRSGQPPPPAGGNNRQDGRRRLRRRAGKMVKLRRAQHHRLHGNQSRHWERPSHPREILPPLAGCFNCGGFHYYASCPWPRTMDFCYGCGIRNVTLRTCPRCHLYWRRRGAFVEELGRNIPWAESLSLIYANYGRI